MAEIGARASLKHSPSRGVRPGRENIAMSSNLTEITGTETQATTVARSTP
jgi:hypothetical protein